VLKRPKTKETWVDGEDGAFGEGEEEEEEGAIGWKEDGRDVGEEKRFELMSETIKSFRKQLTESVSPFCLVSLDGCLRRMLTPLCVHAVAS
jgi:hypothetical protein